MSDHKNRRAWLGIVAALSVSAIAIVALAFKLEPRIVRAALVSADWKWLLLGLLITSCITPLRGLRYRIMLGSGSRLQNIAAVGVQTFMNRVVPMRLGELSLPYLMKRHAEVPITRGVVALLMVRLIELAAVVVLLLVTSVATLGETQVSTSYLLIAFAILVLVLAGFRTVLRLVSAFAISIGARLGLRKGGRVDLVMRKVHKAAVATKRLTSMQNTVVAGLTGAQLLLQIAVFACVLAAFNEHPSVVALVVGSGITFIGTAIPVPSVGTVGPLEASWVLGFTSVGLDFDTAVLTGIATQLFTLLYAALIALPCWRYLRSAAQHDDYSEVA